MSSPLFYEPSIAAHHTHFVLSEESSKHCSQVLRMKAGTILQLTNGNGLLQTAELIDPNKKNTTVVVVETKSIAERLPKKAIALSLLKNTNRLEWFLEKATELGIREIFMLLCERTEHERFRIDRMNQILVSAMLQSQQAWLPVLHAPLKATDLMRKLTYTQKLIAHCEPNEKQPLSTVLAKTDSCIFIGPEGDFTHAEIDTALQHQFIPVSLGITRLRTETAGIAAATLLMNE